MASTNIEKDFILYRPMEQSEQAETQDQFVKIITSDSDPQVFEGNGEVVEVLFHSQDQDRIPSGMPRVFVVTSDPKHPEINRFEEKGDDLMHPIVLFHRKDKAISGANFYEPEGFRPGRYSKRLAITGAIVAASAGLTLLAIRKRKQ